MTENRTASDPFAGRNLQLARWTAIVCAYPKLILLITFGIAAIAVGLTILKLTFQPDRNDLISRELDWNKRYIQYVQQFPSNGDPIVIVEVPDNEDGPQQARDFVDALTQLLRQDERHIQDVFDGFDRANLSPALTRTRPWDEFKVAIEQAAHAIPILASESVDQLLAITTGKLRQLQDASTDSNEAAAQIDQLTNLITVIQAAMTGESAAFDTLSNTSETAGREYLVSEDQKLLFMLVTPNIIEGELDVYVPVAAAIRSAIEETKQAFPTVDAGLTGVPVIEADETEVTMIDSTICSIVAVSIISVLLIVAFHGVPMPILAVVSLLVGVAWSFGFLTLAIGHLQLLSVVFTVILLGLGIDFGIHLISRYELVRHNYPDDAAGCQAALTDTTQTMGPGIITGAVTTAIAFGTTLLTDFKGMAEMGLIASIGILLCMIAMFTVFLSFIRLFRWKHAHVQPERQRKIRIFRNRWVVPFARSPKTTVAIVGVVAALSATSLPMTRFDYNLMNLLPEGIDSVNWQDKLLEHSERSVWFGASIVPLDENLSAAREAAGAFAGLPSVSSVGGVGMLFPADEPKKLELINTTKSQLDQGVASIRSSLPPTSGDDHNRLAGQLTLLRTALSFVVNRQDVKDDATIAASLGKLNEQISKLLAHIGSLSDEDAKTQHTNLTDAFGTWRDRNKSMIDSLLSTDPLSLNDLPDQLRSRCVSVDGKAAVIEVFPKGDVYQPEELEPFVHDMRRIDPDITGTCLQVYETSTLMKSSYLMAGLYAFVAVFVLVWLDFRSIINAALCMVPVTVAFMVTFACMQLMGVSINPANIIVLPLLFGMGVDCGVHIMHRYLAAPRQFPLGLSAGTGKGITLTSITTMIGFGTMLMAHHRGIQSLGFVLAVGMGLTLVAALIVMPALLRLRERSVRRQGV